MAHAKIYYQGKYYIRKIATDSFSCIGCALNKINEHCVPFNKALQRNKQCTTNKGESYIFKEIKPRKTKSL
jgi:hypothetical protein